MSRLADRVEIRLARPEERDALEELQRRASLANTEDRPNLEANPDAIDLPLDLILAGDVLVAEVELVISGFAAVVGGELDGLFVEPDQWRRGIGKALIEAATHLGRKRGFSLTVIANPAAFGFYERCGFSIEGETQTRFGPAYRMSR